MTKTKKPFAPRSALVLAVLSPLVLAACAPSFGASEDLANKATDVVGCESFHSDFYEELYKFPMQQKALPSETDMREAFAKAVGQGRLSQLSSADQVRLADELSELYKLLALDSVRALGHENASDDQKLQDIASLEVGDSSTPEKEELQTRIKAEFSKLDTLLQQTATPACAKAPGFVEAPTTGLTDVDGTAATMFSAWKASQPRAVYGALKTMAVGYQTCDIDRAAVVSKSTPDVQGIKDLGVGADGIGHRRLVSSASDVMRTNPYLANYRKPSSSCFDVSKSPNIYDYGGRPVTTTGLFDLFKNAGSGTTALGIDCSGFVYMAMATSGLRTKKATPLKASTIHGITSTLFTNPQKNGLTCFDFAKFSGNDTLRAGDVVAKAGHVLLIKSVGSDPFGVAGISNVDDCKLANMSISRFNFTIIQDSSVKNGIGMHMHRAADYLAIPDSKLMADGLLNHAVNACKAKFGQTLTTKDSHVAIVRHSGSSDCVQSTELQMERQSCVASCPVSDGITTASNP